jgi:DNA-directed RNA polymerase II subunit RPB2
MRRTYTIPKEISIIRDIAKKEIKLFTDSGRVQRPCFIVERNKLNIKKQHILKLIKGEMNFEDTLKEGFVEFLDVEEEETAMIAMSI